MMRKWLCVVYILLGISIAGCATSPNNNGWSGNYPTSISWENGSGESYPGSTYYPPGILPSTPPRFDGTQGELNERQLDDMLRSWMTYDAMTRFQLAQVWGKTKDLKAVMVLIFALQDEKGAVRLSAADALGKIGDARAIGPLEKLAQNDAGYLVRVAAVNALKEIGGDRITGLLEKIAQNDPESQVRLTARAALSKIRGSHITSADAMMVETSIAALKDKNWSVRRKAAEMLGEIEDKKATEPLIVALKDENSEVRRAAAGALGRIGDSIAVEPLIVALKDKDGYVRANAAWALGEIGNTRSIEPLEELTQNDPNSVVRQAAEEALAGNKGTVAK